MLVDKVQPSMPKDWLHSWLRAQISRITRQLTSFKSLSYSQLIKSTSQVSSTMIKVNKDHSVSMLKVIKQLNVALLRLTTLSDVLILTLWFHSQFFKELSTLKVAGKCTVMQVMVSALKRSIPSSTLTLSETRSITTTNGHLKIRWVSSRSKQVLCSSETYEKRRFRSLSSMIMQRVAVFLSTCLSIFSWTL